MDIEYRLRSFPEDLLLIDLFLKEKQRKNICINLKDENRKSYQMLTTYYFSRTDESKQLFFSQLFRTYFRDKNYLPDDPVLNFESYINTIENIDHAYTLLDTLLDFSKADSKQPNTYQKFLVFELDENDCKKHFNNRISKVPDKNLYRFEFCGKHSYFTINRENKSWFNLQKKDVKFHILNGLNSTYSYGINYQSDRNTRNYIENLIPALVDKTAEALDKILEP